MLLLKLIYDALVTFSENCEKDKRISHYPLLGKPWPMFAIIGLYLLTVLKWGPRFMANRKPYKVEGLMKIYNVMQIVLNGLMCYEAARYFYFREDFSLTCQKYDLSDTSPDAMKLVRPVFLYYVSKYLDLLDTIFFLLRKKFNQISFLHVYHHAIMIFGTYMYCTVSFASHLTSAGIINSFIHVCMYTYYLVAAYKPNINLEPWKRTLTRMQLAQFTILTVVFGLPLYDNWCKLPIVWTLLAFVQNLMMIFLFSNFYYNSYILKDLKKKRKGANSPKVIE